MWEYYHENTWVECKLLHEFLDKFQILYYDSLIKEWVEKLVDYNLIRKKGEIKW